MKEVVSKLMKIAFGKSDNDFSPPKGKYFGLRDQLGRFVYTEIGTRRDQEVLLEDLRKSNITVNGVLNADEVRRTLIFENTHGEGIKNEFCR